MNTSEEARHLRNSLDVRDRLSLSAEELDTLDLLCLGAPVRNGRLALDALKVKLEWSLAKPAQRHEVQQAQILLVKNPYDDCATALPTVETVTTPALPPGQPTPGAASRPRSLAERKAAEWNAQEEARRAIAASRPPPAPAPREESPLG